MRFIKEIIVDSKVIALKVLLIKWIVHGFILPIIVILMLFSFYFSLMKKTYSQVEFDEVRGEWITFVL